MNDEVDIIVDKSNEPDERTIVWQTIRSYPELAAALAGREGDFAKVEFGLEIRGERRIRSWMLSMMRVVGDELMHYTEVFPEKNFKGRNTAKIFRDEAITYFSQQEVDYRAKCN